MKAKPVLLVVLTLLIGFILGMLTSAQIRFNRLKPVRLYFSEERFREEFYKTILPDEKQKAEIQKILDKYAKLNTNLQGNFRKELDLNMKEFRKELDTKLSDEQLARLKEMDQKRQEMIRRSGKNRSDDSLHYREFRRRGSDGRHRNDGMKGHPKPPG
ncbi:MAG: hypothetical protein QG611_131 [Bacteroidota bacterium]|nr:hypothetical protein [Bacteroidota bacterium]